MDYKLILVIVGIHLFVVCLGLPLTVPEESTETGCRKYDYCRGQSFEKRFDVGNYRVLCETDDISEKYIRENCCLPSESHMVCYDITIETEKLNYSNETGLYQTTTDFSDLCAHMVKAVGKKPGQYNAAMFGDGGGEVAFLYGAWKEVPVPSERHIKHLACGIEE